MDEIQKTGIMTHIKQACITIPIYKNELDSLEKISLKQSLKIFKDESVYIISPEGLSIENLITEFKLSESQFKYFDPSFFKNIDGYNKLLMSSVFYEAFEEYKYLLICQLDVFVFKNDLNYWSNKNYDYIGAPWLDSEPSFLRDFGRLINKNYRQVFNKKQRSFEHLNKVGNGGFSLRKIYKHIEICKKQTERIAENIKKRPGNNYHIEDVFWSIQVPQLYPEFRIPEYKEALNFAFDRKPKLAFKLNNNVYPFACHGFNKPKVFSFWKTKIEALKVL